jgi:hypothetical protein
MQKPEIQAAVLRAVVLGSVTKQHSNGRIVISMRMPLNGDSLGTVPDWVARGYEAVAKQFTEVDPEIQAMEDLAIAFTADNQPGELFSKRAVKIASASLRSFKIKRVGKPDEPEVELQFKLYLAFARQFWAWAGEMAGEEVYMTFPAGEPDEGPVAETAQLPLEAAAETEDEDEEIPLNVPPLTARSTPTLEQATGESEPAPDAGPKSKKKQGGKKSGPTNLRELRAKEVGAGRSIQ